MLVSFLPIYSQEMSRGYLENSNEIEIIEDTNAYTQEMTKVFKVFF